MSRSSVARPVMAAVAMGILAQPVLAQEPAPEAATMSPMVAAAPRFTGSPTRPSDEQAKAAARQIPGNVPIVPAEACRDRPAVTTNRDMLLYAPGVFAEPKWGEDSRRSIRGSGTARNVHLRGVRLYQDRIPIDQADGSADFQELDPLPLERIEVFRGANAFVLGANTPGGGINFITPTGRSNPGALLRAEGGSFGVARGQATYGIAHENRDAWGTVTAMSQEGHRDHGCGAAATTRITVRLPEGVTGARPMPKPGWTMVVTPREGAAAPTGHGSTPEVAAIIWKGGRLPNEHDDAFVLRFRAPDAPGTTLWFPVRQECEGGAVTDRAEGRRLSDYPHPAAALRLTQR